MKAFLDLDSGLTRGTVPDDKDTLKTKNQRLRIKTKNQRLRVKTKNQKVKSKNQRIKSKNQKIQSKNQRIKSKDQKVNQLKEELRIAKKKRAEITERKDQKISLLKNELRTVKHAAKREMSRENKFQTFQTNAGPGTGALPDFVIIGAQKSGTTVLYQLLTRHPHVEHAALKEVHYFDLHFERGIEWYRRCFTPPRWEDGRRTITGEATPQYLFDPSVPERMAEVVPEARLIVLLRNPVDRAYSGYHHALRNGREIRSFEEAIEAEEKWLLGKGGEDPDNEQHLVGGVVRPPLAYLRRGIYVDQLMRWSKHFRDEQMLVLKSEEFFEHTPEKLKVVLDFLGLPEWEPEAWEVGNQGSYKEMDVSTRRRLEAFFEPHNQRLYDYLGVDLGW